MNYVDMHMHSTYSDGEYSVRELFDIAEEKELSAIILTDHDFFEAYDEILQNSKRTGVQTIIGTEISTMFNSKELHLLAYGFDRSHKMLVHQLAKVRESRIIRAEKIVSNLNKYYGVKIDINRVLELGGSNPGRPHLAKVLVEEGYVISIQEAFDRYLHGKGQCNEPKFKLDIERIIKTVHHANGICSIAHCGKYFSKQQLKQLIKWGMDGIEVFHPSHSPSLVVELKKICQEYDLIVTGGSDFHGNHKFAEMGSQFVDEIYFDSMLRRLSKSYSSN